MFVRQRCTRVMTEEDAVRCIAVDFPNVPPRIIVDVVNAYCSRSRSMPEAAQAARARLRDACAVTTPS